jgi:hypothetical protein
MELDEAIAHTIDMLRDDRAKWSDFDLYPSQVATAFADQQLVRDQDHYDREVGKLTPIFMDAAWKLCRRGLVRPGVRNRGGQPVGETGYSLTKAGRAALADIDPANILVMQPGSLAATFEGFKKRFGDGFMQRSSEAIRCRNAEAWLGCCAHGGSRRGVNPARCGHREDAR